MLEKSESREVGTVGDEMAGEITERTISGQCQDAGLLGNRFRLRIYATPH